LRRSIILGAVLLSAIGSASAQGQRPPQLANPASVRCVDQGGALKIEKRPDGGQYGVCTFVDNYQCEEWALFRGECPKGGLRVTGYVTPAGRFCAITGGRYAVSSPPTAAVEKGVCSLPGGKTCDADAYYAGACTR
jgi:putative hemolysin